MRFHGLLLVRDEDDIIEETIRHAFTWIDSIFALDTGSTDETYAILERLAAEYPGLHLLGRHAVRFDQSLRSYLFAKARHTFVEGDWIVKLDADEFYHITPPDFVRTYADPHDGVIDLKWYYFRLTAEEVAAYESGAVDLSVDRRRPIAARRRFYKLTSHREPRLFRYRSSMRFAAMNSAPTFAGIRCSRPIPVLHYPHRDPLQMQKRFSLRAQMKALGSKEGGHWDISDWRREVIAETSHGGERGALATQPGHTDGPLLYWSEGEELPDITAPDPSSPGLPQLARKLFYAGPVRLADRLKPGFNGPDLLKHRALSCTEAERP